MVNNNITISNLELNFILTNKKSLMIDSFSLINSFYSFLNKSDFENYLLDIENEGNYQMLIIYHKNNIIAVAGLWIITRFYIGKYMQVGNMIVDKNYRKKKIAQFILDYSCKYAKANNCKRMVLDSHKNNITAHRIYMRDGFEIDGFHFIKSLV